jgi:nicotinic acid mononucleotide adenylyltransferase
LRGFPIAVASSDIRARLKAGLPVTGLTPDAVAGAIANKRLYF